MRQAPVSACTQRWLVLDAQVRAALMFERIRALVWSSAGSAELWGRGWTWREKA